MKKIFYSFALICTFICSGASAQDTIPVKDKKERGLFKRLESNEPNYVAWTASDDTDNNHSEFYISLKYPIFSNLWEWGADVLFIYNGKYDFYIGSRDSAPIVSRLQNPGIAIEKAFNGKNGPHNLRIGWYHESNGQSVETQTQFNNTENAIDHVSRGWDYLGIDYKKSFKPDLIFDTSLRLFCDCQAMGFLDKREDEIFWRPVVEQPSIWDFDGFRTGLEYSPGKIGNFLTNVRIRADIRTGLGDSDAFGNVSGKLSLSFRIADNIPLSIFYFNGYGKDISTYHRRDQYIGFGFVFQ